jgi:filamentous hemagglutinin family protein
MNCIYRSIWNDATGTFVAVSENARSAGKKTSTCTSASGGGAAIAIKALAISLMMVGAGAWAAPMNGVVSAGGATIGGAPGSLVINQSTQSAAIHWQSFNVAAGESVRFIQPSSNAVALNRVLGSDPSSILGTLIANGKVFLVNPNGILFGKGASVNVGGLVASSLNISDADFMAGNYRFSSAGAGAVANHGTINAPGGHVALLGANVSNDGVITARLGSVALAAGNAITLDVAGDGLLNVAISQGTVNALVQNGGLIQADGGQVLLSARAAGGLLQGGVNNSGVIQARSLENRNGAIRLLGDAQSGTVQIGGTLDVSGTAAGQAAGSVIATGQHIGLFDGKINASGDTGGGTVLIGGDFQGKNPSVPNASATYMSTDSTINADAKSNGSGGKIVLWGDNSTRAYGSITSRGGAQGGDGGLIETSGHALDVTGIKIDASAPNGKAGTWLLDPADVTIGTGTSNGTFTGNVFSPNSSVASATVDAGALQTILNGGTDVTISTANTGGSGAGNITVNSALTWTKGQTLTLIADHDVIVNSGSAMTASTQNSKIVLTAKNDVKVNAALVASGENSQILLTAGHDVLATAAITASELNTAIKMTAGNDVIAIGAVTATGRGSVIDMGAGNNVSVVAVTADGGGAVNSVNLHANKDVLVNGSISAAGGNVMLRADNDGTGPGVLGGTVRFLAPGEVVASTVTAIRFNPDGYTNTTSEIANYDAKVTGTLDAKAWVFPVGVDKPYDGLTTATLQFKNPLPADNPNVGNTVTLNGGTATFDTKDVGTLKSIDFKNYTLGGIDSEKFSLFSLADVATGNGTTTGNITPIALTVTANNHIDKSYGGAITFAGTEYTSNGLVNSEAVGKVTLVSRGTATTAPVGGYAITPSNAAANGAFLPSNYNIRYVDGALKVTPAPLTVTASDVSKPYGQTLVPTAFTTAGLVNGDTVASVTETSSGTSATAGVAGSPYPIIPVNAAGGTFTASNYAITYVNGKMTVTPIPLIVTASDVSKPYGQTLVPTAFTTAGLVNGDTVASVTETSSGTSATAGVAGSPYPIIPTSAAGGTFTASNYTITYVNGKMTVTPRALTVTASDATKPYGQTLVPTAFTTTGLVNGDSVTSVTETSPGTAAGAAPGPYAITPSSATGGTFTPSNYAIVYANGGLTVDAPVVVPPVVVPPVVVPPVVVPPVVVPPVVVLPVVVPPVVVVEPPLVPPVAVEPQVTPSPPASDDAPPTMPPMETPVTVVPPATPNGPMPVIVFPAPPVELESLLPPVAFNEPQPELPVVPGVPAAPVKPAVPVTAQPREPAVDVPLHRARKQDRN